MKYIFYFLFGIAILVLCSAVKGATLTTHAKHILWNEIDSIDKSVTFLNVSASFSQ